MKRKVQRRDCQLQVARYEVDACPKSAIEGQSLIIYFSLQERTLRECIPRNAGIHQAVRAGGFFCMDTVQLIRVLREIRSALLGNEKVGIVLRMVDEAEELARRIQRGAPEQLRRDSRF